MRTECTTNALPFQAAGRRVGRRAVLARFDGGTLTTEASLVRQRVYGLALGYEDLNDHERLRHDPLRALLAEVDDLTAPLAASVRSTVSS